MTPHHGQEEGGNVRGLADTHRRAGRVPGRATAPISHCHFKHSRLPPTQKFSFPTTADPQEKGGRCPKSERKVLMEHLLCARHCAGCSSFIVTSSMEVRFYYSHFRDEKTKGCKKVNLRLRLCFKMCSRLMKSALRSKKTSRLERRALDLRARDPALLSVISDKLISLSLRFLICHKERITSTLHAR